MAIIVLFVIIFLGVGGFFYHKQRSGNKEKRFPDQKRLLVKLIKELKSGSVDIVLMNSNAERISGTMNLFDGKQYPDIQQEFSSDAYDETRIFFSNNERQLLDFELYTASQALPKEVLYEVLDFYNESYTVVNPELPCFVITNDPIKKNNPLEIVLYSGSGEAFNSWSSFKEGVENLNYVIGQWIKDNASQDIELNSIFHGKNEYQT